MGEAFALAAALCYGITHFFNGMLARRASGIAVAAFAQVGGTMLIVLLALLFPAALQPVGSALAWGAVSGIGAGLGMAALYRGVARGRMSVVVPVSDVNAAILPVLVGTALFGERPPLRVLVGIAVAVPAIWLVSRGSRTGAAPSPLHSVSKVTGRGKVPRPRGAAGTADGLLAGAGVALMWIALAQVPAGGGLWPLVASRAVSVLVVVPLAVATRTSLRLSATITVPAGLVGAVGTLATVLYFLATREQLLAVASVLAALYPVLPVLLALVFLHERVTKRQAVGLAGAALAISLIALG